jgi:hypothetical protein
LIALEKTTANCRRPVKQYVRDHLCLRTEPATNDVTDYGVKKAVEKLPQLREKLVAICDNYLTVQQDILEIFVDRGQLRKLTEPTVLPSRAAKCVALPLTVGIEMGLYSGFPMVKNNSPCL